MVKNPLDTIKILFLGLLLAFGISYASAAWVGPTATPPGNNTSAPINVGSLFQEKTGNLWAAAMGTDNGYCIGNSCITAWPTGGGTTSVAFGTWQAKTTGTVYQAATDGFVIADLSMPSGTVRYDYAFGYTDNNANLITKRASARVVDNGGSNMTQVQDASFTMPVRKGDYWKVVRSGDGLATINVWWIPLVVN